MSIKTNDDIMEYLSHNVSYLRKRQKISKRKMAEILGIGVNSLNKIEQGILPPRLSVKILFRIEDYFGIPVSVQLSIKIGKRLKNDIYGE